MKRKIISTIVALYAVTWAGGWITRSLELKSNARLIYAEAKARDESEAKSAREEGYTAPDRSDRLSKNGPSTWVSWCFPILPGVLVMNFGTHIGPLWGFGGTSIVLYYGFGTKDVVWIIQCVS